MNKEQIRTLVRSSGKTRLVINMLLSIISGKKLKLEVVNIRVQNRRIK